MKGRPTEELVYEYMFPKPRPGDPQNFTALLQRHLVLEVRQEVHSFYGHLDTQEAKYPGLDYNHPTHRTRLCRWQWHRRLFRAFDGLRLTPAEISGMTRWEGTKWAKERFERDAGITIHDTAADGFPDWDDIEDRPPAATERATSQETEDRGEPADDRMAEESDEELESVGVALNERLRERVELLNRSGDTSVPIDEEWEQWLKNAIESGEFPQVAGGPQNGITADAIFPSAVLAAARAGRWNEVPEFLHDMIRVAIEGEPGQPPVRLRRRGPEGPADTAATSSPTSRRSLYSDRRRTFSNLRLPLADSDGPALPRTTQRRA